VCHSSFLTAKSVNLVVAHDGFLSQHKLSMFFIVVTLITKELFEQLFIVLLCNGLKMLCNEFPLQQHNSISWVNPNPKLS